MLVDLVGDCVSQESYSIDSRILRLFQALCTPPANPQDDTRAATQTISLMNEGYRNSRAPSLTCIGTFSVRLSVGVWRMASA